MLNVGAFGERMKAEHAIELVTDHFQVLFGDGARAPLVDTTSLWDVPEGVVSLSGFPELVGLGTTRYGGTTRLSVRIEARQESPPSGWQPMGAFEVYVPSGRLIFWGPEIEDIDDAHGVELSPGRYQGAAFSRATEQVLDEMASSGPDEYLIVLSPAEVSASEP